MTLTDSAIRCTAILLGLWACLNAASWLADRRAWANGAPLGWDIQSLRRAWQRLPWRMLPLTGPALSTAAALQLLAGLSLLLWPAIALPALAVLIMTQLLYAIRAGADGADKMALVVSGGLLALLTGTTLGQPLLILNGTLWIGGQLTLAYWTAGASKLQLAGWRDGTALQQALTSNSYGTTWTAALVRSPGRAKLLAWTIIAVELAFPLALLAPPAWLAAILALFLAFHMLIALAMGLNLYILAFAAAYPATMLLGQALRQTLGWAS
jgi:hypothetical protein